jgi:DNA-directed RNA polymerase specialized sigma24 family protein
MPALAKVERGVLIDYFWAGRTQEGIGREAGVSQVAIKKRIDRAPGSLRSRSGDSARLMERPHRASGHAAAWVKVR